MAFNSISELRKARGGMDSLMKEVDRLATAGDRKEDDRFWQPTVDKAGNGFATIRFLAPPKGEDLPWVQIWNHGFQGPTGKWYIENSLTTIGKNDPVSELNSKLWNSGIESDKDIVRKQKRKLTYISNIMVVKDSEHPENEGKVFLFKYGMKIFDKIKDVMKPQFEDETAINPFDFWDGANFKLKIRKVEGYRNYDKSEFDKPSALSQDDDQIEAIWGQEFSLKEFLAAENFKSYEELSRKLHAVLNDQGAGMTAESTELQETAAKAPAKETKAKAVAKETPAASDDDDSMSYFANLANQD